MSRGSKFKSRFAPNEPADADVKVWARLAREARRFAAEPQAFAGDFARAANKATKAVIPKAERGAKYASPFYRLVVMGQRFAGMLPAQRAAAASDLTAMATSIEKALGLTAEPPPTATVRPRPDISFYATNPRKRADLDN